MHYYKLVSDGRTSVLESSAPLGTSGLIEITIEEAANLSAAPTLTKTQIFQEVRVAAPGLVAAFANAIRQRVAKATHYLQATRWPVQLAAAQDVLANGEAASDLNKSMLDMEARLRERGETREQLAGKVLANSQAFTLVGACVDGIETATLDKIAAYAGADPEAFGAIVAQAKLDAHVELVAIFTPTLGEAQAEALVAQIVGA